MGDPFKWMEAQEANAECRITGQHTGTNCPKCSMRVILHCSSCKIQVTACLCSTIARFGEDKTFMMMVEKYGEAQAREQFRKAGLYVPNVPKIHLPGED